MTTIPAPRAPKLEIYVDGTNFNLALRREGLHHPIDLNLLATRLSAGYHFVKLRYYTAPLADTRGQAYAQQQKFSTRCAAAGGSSWCWAGTKLGGTRRGGGTTWRRRRT